MDNLTFRPLPKMAEKALKMPYTMSTRRAGGHTLRLFAVLLLALQILFAGAQAARASGTGQVRFFPRAGSADRMRTGKFQGSQDNVTYTDLYTIPTVPADGQWTTAVLSVDPKTYRYLRYLSPDTAYGNVAEVEFDSGTGVNAVKITGTPFGTPGSFNNSGNTFNKVFDGNTATFFDAPGPNGDFAGIDQGGASVTVTSVTPSTATVSGGQTQQFAATVSGTGNPGQSVTWTASAGTISTTGLFTAPAATSSVQTITVTATSTVDNTKHGTATVTVPAIAVTVTGVSVTPSTATVTGGQTQQFSATVSGTGNPAQTVTWTASAGSVTSAGLFTAPAATASVQTITVTATSTVNNTKSGTAAATVPAAGGAGQVRFFPRPGSPDRMRSGKFQGSQDNVTYTDLYTIPTTPPDQQWTTAVLSVDPKTYRYLRYLSPDTAYGNVAEVEFDTGTGVNAVKVTGTPFGTPGSFNNSGNTFDKVFDGNTATYFDAPGPNGNYAGIDQGGASATVTSVSVTPSTATVSGGQTQQFAATVSGTGSPAQTVTWTASAGTISSAGLFTAPAATASVQTVTVTATSTVDNTKHGSATVTVPAAGGTGSVLKIGFLGDSITYGIGDGGGPGCYDWALTYLGQNGYQGTGVNYGNNGASVSSFYQQTSGPIQAFEQAGVTVVSIMLGTNDARLDVLTTAQQYHDKLLWIINSFLAPGTGIQKVILNYSPYIQSSAASSWDGTADPRLVTYQAQIDSLCNGTTILQGDKMAYSFFQQHPEQGDGVHPTPPGHQDLGKLWAIGITNALGGTNTLSYPTGIH